MSKTISLTKTEAIKTSNFKFKTFRTLQHFLKTRRLVELSVLQIDSRKVMKPRTHQNCLKSNSNTLFISYLHPQAQDVASDTLIEALQVTLKAKIIRCCPVIMSQKPTWIWKWVNVSGWLRCSNNSETPAKSVCYQASRTNKTTKRMSPLRSTIDNKDTQKTPWNLDYKATMTIQLWPPTSVHNVAKIQVFTLLNAWVQLRPTWSLKSLLATT